MSKEFKLEDGKRYVRKDGSVSGIIRALKTTNEHYKFIDERASETYCENGAWIQGKTCAKDLIREYIRPRKLSSIKKRTNQIMLWS